MLKNIGVKHHFHVLIFGGHNIDTMRQSACLVVNARGYKTFFILSSTKLEIIMLINVKMPTVVGILTFASMMNTTSNMREFDSKKSLSFSALKV